MSKITINDIAKEAGVSKTAVSFAFNDPGQLATTTVEHIHAVAERLGYSPDPIARSMTTRRTNALGLLLPQDIASAMQNPFYAQLIRGIGHICNDAGKTLMIVPPLRGSRLKAIPHATVDGFIVVGLEVDRGEVVMLRRRSVPFVIVDSVAPDDVPSVNVDDRSGARAAMRHVLELGHRTIGVVCIESGKPGGRKEYTGTLGERLLGYCEALDEFAISPDDPRVCFVEAPSSWQGGREAFEALWGHEHRPTAVVAMSDILAIGVLETARDFGLTLPDELSLVGFDDLPDARLMRPALTTVRQPVEEKGRLAAELLVAAIDGDAPVQHRVLPTELIVRGSVIQIG
ncbi:MAG: LacI family DNA-binding transcriptional regulator [Roseiflexaceae bacterium]|nr:LacI family DNA-binding transcriptional regulator [Roseiflexaceae bacterium]